MENTNKTNNILLGLFLATTLLLGGFIVYDKLLKKEEVVDCPKCEEKECPQIEATECPKCESETCNCPTCSNYGTKISSLKKLTLTTSNQTVKVGNKTIKIRKGATDNDYDHVFINDTPIVDSYQTRISVEAVYLTNKYIFFTSSMIMGEHITYVFNEDDEIFANNNGYGMSDFKLVDGYLHATGAQYCGIGPDDGPCPDKDLIIKYIDNTLIVTPYK